jgi:hypothetical protein
MRTEKVKVKDLLIGEYLILIDFERNRTVRVHEIDDTGKIWVLMPEGDILDVDLEDLRRPMPIF